MRNTFQEDRTGDGKAAVGIPQQGDQHLNISRSGKGEEGRCEHKELVVNQCSGGRHSGKANVDPKPILPLFVV